MSDFASRKGKMRCITSPILSNDDTDAIINSEYSDRDAFKKFEEALLDNVQKLEKEMKSDILNAFSWMLYDGIIEMKFAIPCKKLEEGDFHDKFGIFYRGEDAVSFSGSIMIVSAVFKIMRVLRHLRHGLERKNMWMRI